MTGHWQEVITAFAFTWFALVGFGLFLKWRYWQYQKQLLQQKTTQP